jgi:hypothetical protein
MHGSNVAKTQFVRRKNILQTVCVCVCLFNVRAEHVIRSRVLKAPRGAKDAGGGRPPALKLEASVHVFYGS